MKGIQTLLLLTILGCVMAQEDTEPYVTVDITQGHAHPGENVTFECRVTNKGENVVTIGKSVILGPDQTSVEQISNNDFLYPTYENSGRHELRMIGPHGSKTILYLTMWNVNAEDTARYTCMVLKTEAFASVNFEVYDLPDEVKFENYTDGDNITLEEHEGTEIRCHAKGVVPLPSMHMTVGDRVVNNFHEKHDVEARCPPSGDFQKTCLLHYQFNKESYNHRFIPTFRDNGKNLTCNVTVPMSKLPPRTVNLSINVLHDPKIECNMSTYKVVHHHKNLEIKCNVSYNPDLTSLTLSAMQDEVRLDPGEHTEGIHFIQFVVNRFVSEVTILIPDVMSKHFGPYTLYAENDRSINSFQVDVQEDRDGSIGGGSNLACSFWTLLSLLFLALLH